MLVKMIREKHLQAAGPLGPSVRILAVGELVDLPAMHASMFVAGGDAVEASAAPKRAPHHAEHHAPADSVDAEAELDEVPARRRRKG